MSPRTGAIALALALIVSLGVAWWLAGARDRDRVSSSPTSETSASSPQIAANSRAASATGSSPTSPTKTRQRPSPSRLNLEETAALIRQPLSGTADFPEQSLADRIDAINRLLREKGIDPRDLRIEAGDGPGMLERLPNTRMEELRMNQATPAEILKYTTGVTRFHWRLKPGVIQIRDATEPDPDLPLESDPSLFDPELSQPQDPPPDGENDPFSPPDKSPPNDPFR